MASSSKTQLINYLLEHSPLKGSAFQKQILQAIDKLSIKPTYPIILVGGTNGKGSVCAYLSTILTNINVQVGSFTSPHVFEYNERICLNNHPIEDEELVYFLDKVMQVDNNLGLFTTFCLAAHLFFMAKKVDIAVIEVGIGGKHDCTNLFEPTISAITNVELDHCNLLGNTRDEIALQKAHLYRANNYNFYGGSDVPTSLIHYANSVNARVEYFNKDFKIIYHDHSWDLIGNNMAYYSLPYPALRGVKQPQNVALALAILHKLKHQFPFSISQVKSSILTTKLNGRFEVLPGRPQIILDVAHNEASVSHMLENLIKLPFTKHTYAIFGIAHDKDYKKIIAQCKPIINKWFIAPITSSRSIDIQELKAALKDEGIKDEDIFTCESLAKATSMALKLATIDDKVVCFGSFLVVEEAYKNLKQRLTNV